LATPAASTRIYQLASSPLRTAFSSSGQWLTGRLTLGLALLGSGVALLVTNPTMEDYQTHAGEELVELATEEICGQNGMPILMQLWVKDCPGLIASQQSSLAALSGQFTTRLNLGLLSVFTTEVGGQKLLPALRLPRYQVTTVGVAGHFLTVNSRSEQADLK